MPFTTPITLTSRDQRQSLTWCSHSWPSDPEPIPALLHSRWTAPVPLYRGIPGGSDRLERCDVGHHAGDLETPVRQLRGRPLDEGGDDVGQHDLHPLPAEALHHRPPDALASAGDDRHLADYVSQDGLPLSDVRRFRSSAHPSASSRTDDCISCVIAL